MRTELVFREVPGKLLQWRRQMERFRRRCLRGTLVQSPGDGVVRVPLSPVGLRILPSGGLTLRLATGSLPISHSRVRLEPPAADCTGLLPDLRHRDDPSWSSRARLGQVKLSGSLLESTGGSVLESAEAVHPYANKRPQPWEPKWEEDFGFAASKYPLIATEFGGFALPPAPGAPPPAAPPAGGRGMGGNRIDPAVYGSAIIKYLEGRGISWTVWCFDPEWGPTLIRDWQYTLNPSGEFAKAAMNGRLQ